MYSIVLRAHLNTGHGGRDKMLKEVNKKYANVTRDVKKHLVLWNSTLVEHLWNFHFALVYMIEKL
jgi:hypothetical protein